MSEAIQQAAVTAPMSEYLSRLLILGFIGVPEPDPQDGALRDELALKWGAHGELAGSTWRAHEQWLREEAKRQGFPRLFNNQYFGEAMLASGGRW